MMRQKLRQFVDLATIKLSIADLGAAMPLQEILEALGHSVSWDSESASGPNPETAYAGLVMIDANSKICAQAVHAWRNFDPPPGILLIGDGKEAQAKALKTHSTLIASFAKPEEFSATISSVLSNRFTDRMSVRYARSKLGLGESQGTLEDAIQIIRAARSLDIEFVKTSLRWCANDYIFANTIISELRGTRTLLVPEVEILNSLDGTNTLQRFLANPSGDGTRRGRFIWALLSAGVALATQEPADEKISKHKHIASVRRNLAARRQRLLHATHYDVLEVSPQATPEIVDYAARTLAIRYSPDKIKCLDLGIYNSIVESNWHQILTARETLMDKVDRLHYNNLISAKKSQLRSPWAFNTIDTQSAQNFFHRGQLALVAGETLKAVSGMAGACRNHPGYPDYEISLCWARFRADVERGGDRDTLIAAKRQEAESYQVGHRPWPKALTALALLCSADNDAPSARYYLQEALAVELNLPVAKRLLRGL